MIKKIILSIFFGALIFHPSAYAQTITIPMPTISSSPSPQPTPVDYQLPYPGLLPGTPLYSIKLIRDKITEITASSFVDKSNFYLLQADKRLAASLMLYKKGETDLALETLFKSQIYLEKSYEKMIEGKKSQENVSDIYVKIKTSTAKQKEQIGILTLVRSGEDTKKLHESLEITQEIENKVNSFKP